VSFFQTCFPKLHDLLIPKSQRGDQAMDDMDVIARLIRETQPCSDQLEQILSLSEDQIIKTLIGLKGGFVYRAYLIERLMELTGGPRGIAVPESIYRETILFR
jgi:hypothetical protein